MKRLVALAVALVLASATCAQEQAQQPGPTHVQAYRDRLAFYKASGFDMAESLVRMKNYFPGFGVRFGIEVDRAGTERYYVAIGTGTELTFYALLN